MKGIRVAVIISFVLAMMLSQRSIFAAPSGPSAAATARSSTTVSMKHLPLVFEANRGQADGRVRYLAHGPGYTLFLTRSTAAFTFQQPVRSISAVQPSTKLSLAALLRNTARTGFAHVMRLQALGANLHPQFLGLQRLPGVANYFLGNNPRQWHTNIPTFARIVERNVYRGIDLAYYGHGGRLEYDWVLHPHANPSSIRFSIQGAQPRLDARGNLVLWKGAGEIVQEKPAIYQEIGGARKAVAGRYTFHGGQIGFTLGRYDSRRPLTIDPTIVYSGLIGGGGAQFGSGIGVGTDGSVYVTGTTASADFPTAGPIPGGNALHGTSCSGTPCADTYVAKLNRAGNTLVYSTYIGGAFNDFGGSLAVDGSGDAYVLGQTFSSDFPTVAAAQATYAGGKSGNNFVLKLNPSGNALLYSTYLGGTGGEAGGDIAVDGTGNAYVTGFTFSKDFPTKNPLQSSLKGKYNAEVTKYDPTGQKVYGTYLGGSGGDWGRALTVDGSGNVYVTGATNSSDFPGPHPLAGGNAYHNFTCGSGASAVPCNDAFVAIVKADGSAVTASAYLGSSGEDYGTGIALDRSGNIDVSGITRWTDFPTKNPLAGGDKYHGLSDIFLAQLNSSLSTLTFSTYFGGTGNNSSFGLKVDASGNMHIAGSTNSTDFPIKGPISRKGKAHGGICTLPPSNTSFTCRDIFVASINPKAGIVYSTYLGGSNDDLAGDLALDSAGNTYVVGNSKSSDFPIAVVTTKHTGTTNVVVAKVSQPPTPRPTAKTVKPSKKCKKGYVKVKGKCTKKKK